MAYKARTMEYLGKYGEEVTLDVIKGMALEELKGYFWDGQEQKMLVRTGKEVGGGTEKAQEEYMRILRGSIRAAYVEACRRDFWWEFLFQKIKTKSAGVVTFKPKRAQKRLVNVIKGMEAGGRPVRIKCGKSRQGGVSTFVELYIYLKTKRLINSRALVIADKTENSKNLYEMYKLYFSRDPTRRPGRPMTKTLIYDKVAGGSEWETENLVWDPYDIEDLADGEDELKGQENSGWVRVDSGFNKQSGRSFTVQFLHCSELAFWADLVTTMTALMQVVPYLKDTAIIYETTGDGLGGWWPACWKSNDDGFERFFTNWLDDEDCATKIYTNSERKSIEDTLDKEEEKLIADYGATLEQLKFRRRKIGELHGNIDMWNQEYPTTEDDMFLGSGRPVFQIGFIRSMLEENREWEKGNQVRKYNFNLSNMGKIVNGSPPELMPKRNGDLWIFEQPKLRHDYIVGGDPAEGKMVDPSEKEPDWCAIQVFDRGGSFDDEEDRMVQVAEAMVRVEPDVFALMLWGVAAFYNGAWVVPEANADGRQVMKELMKYYKRVMKRPNSEMVENVKKNATSFKRSVSMITDGNKDRFGWYTNPQTRPFMVKETEKLIRTGLLHIRSERCMGQMQTFVYDDNGRPAAQAAEHDDLVMAMCLAAVGNVFCPRGQSIVSAGNYRFSAFNSTLQTMMNGPEAYTKSTKPPGYAGSRTARILDLN